MVDTTYQIETKSNGTLTAEYNTGDPNNWRIGETAAFEFEIPESDFPTLSEFATYAGSFATMEMLDSSVKYKNQLPDDAGISSLAVGIRPSNDLQNRDVVGVWGLVETIDNARNSALTTDRYQVDVTVLAPIGDYADHTALEEALLIGDTGEQQQESTTAFEATFEGAFVG